MWQRSRQVFWLAIHPPGSLPNLLVSDILPFVIAYSGGSAGDSHPSSLFTLAGTVIRLITYG